MPVRHAHAKSLTARGSSSRTGHLGRRPRLVDEDEVFRIELQLIVEPGLPAPQDVRTGLLRGMR
jgi:hypothetical protein